MRCLAQWNSQDSLGARYQREMYQKGSEMCAWISLQAWDRAGTGTRVGSGACRAQQRGIA